MSDGTPRNALTVDVEDWFQVSNFDHVVRRDEWDRYPSRVEANTRRLLDLFDETGAKATCFVLGWVAERFPGLVAEIRDRGHDVASHGHLHELVHAIGRDRFARDLASSLAAIERACGVRPRGYRAPSFSIDRRSFWAFDVLAEQGIAYDSSVYPVRHPRYGVPAFPRSPRRVRTPAGAELREFPLTTLRVLGRNLGASGGAYLRILPLAVLQRAFAAMNAAGEPAVLYVHPWEVDPDQPRLRTGRWGGITHYANLHATAPRLRALLRSFPFAPMERALDGAPGLGAAPVEVAA
jgi:polysaccharide deacetylase family protein (PEP-CTERM system associated)